MGKGNPITYSYAFSGIFYSFDVIFHKHYYYGLIFIHRLFMLNLSSFLRVMHSK